MRKGRKQWKEKCVVFDVRVYVFVCVFVCALGVCARVGTRLYQLLRH